MQAPWWRPHAFRNVHVCAWISCGRVAPGWRVCLKIEACGRGVRSFTLQPTLSCHCGECPSSRGVPEQSGMADLLYV